jgi:LuxR family maltose regulon positive regulatory protein
MQTMTIVSKTKTQFPQFSQDYLPRPRLVQAGQMAVLQHKLTLISAPAGAGKTTFAASVMQAVETEKAWLRLDAGDNDPQTFVTALVQALQTAVPQIGEQIVQFIHNTADPAQTLRQALTLLVNDLHDMVTNRLLLVLDDYHTIENTAVHQAVPTAAQCASAPHHPL